MPLIGNTVAGYTGYGVKVDHAELEEGDGSSGVLTVTLRNPNTDSVVLQGGGGAATVEQGQAGDGLPEIRWQPFRRKIESHPLCGRSNLPPGTAASPDGHIPQANYTAVDGGWDFDDYQSLIKAGITEYDEPQPVLSLQTEWYSKPTNFGQNNYSLDSPPTDQGLAIPVAIHGGDPWRWLRGGDSLTRQNKRWHLQQTWTGFRPGPDRNSAFELLYESST